MDDERILDLTGKIESTLGKEQFATISDTIGEILTGNTMNMQAISDRDKEIATLKDRNEKLVTANGALLQKIPMKKVEERSEEVKEPVKIDLKSAFDKNGRFIH